MRHSVTLHGGPTGWVVDEEVAATTEFIRRNRLLLDPENSALDERTARGLRPRAVTRAQMCRLGRLAYL